MPNPQSSVSVVIPAHNAAATIASTLASLAPDGDLIGEILLIDDRSDDGTAIAARTAALAHDLPLVVVPSHAGGAGAARNVGLASAQFPCVFFLDADDRIEPLGLGSLHRALLSNPGAGLAIGAHVRRTEGRPDKLKVPAGYGTDRSHLVRDYLLGKMWPIAVGSALFRRDAADGIAFPKNAVLDEDTCFWAELMSKTGVVTVDVTVLVYRLNEARTGRRYSAAPRSTFVGVARALGHLGRTIGDRDAVQWRKAWVALRIARQLLLEHRYEEAKKLLRMVAAHRAFARSWRLTRYRLRAAVGMALASPRPLTCRPSPCTGTIKTLILTTDPAWPPISGADLRNAQNAVAAAPFGPVMLLSMLPILEPAEPPAGVEVLSPNVPISTPERQPPKSRSRFEAWIDQEAISRAVDIARAFAPDTIIVEGIHLDKLLPQLRAVVQCLVLDMHNVESELSALIRKTNPRRTLKSLLGLETKALRRRERAAIPIVDRFWVCSEADASRFYRLHHPRVPIDIVPNGIPRGDSVPVELPVRDRSTDGPRMLFFSHLGYRPNITAARRLACRILPAVRRTLPSANLVLAGRSPGSKVADLADVAGVVMLRNPPDADAVLADADIVVVPLEAGGGTRLKILEAMAWGLPVVATSIAAEGLGLEAGSEFVLATTDEEFAQAIVALWLDREGYEAVRHRARETVMLRFGASAIERAVRNGLGLNVRTTAST